MSIRSMAVAIASASFMVSSAGAQWWNPQDPTPPKFRGTPMEPKPRYNHQLVDIAQMSIWAFLQNKEYAKVDRMYDEFLRDRIRASDGALMLDAFRRALSTLFQVYDEDALRKILDQWREASPGSRLLPVAEADMWQALAWKARGDRSFSETSPEGRNLFVERLRRASKALEASADAGKESPLWYWVALVVAGGTGRPEAQFDALYDEAVTRFPSYLPLYYTRANFLLPQWGGDWGKVDRFAEDAVRRTQGSDGRALYAWIYADAATKVEGNFFSESEVDWPRLRASFQDLVKRYPDPWNRSLFVTFACLARDKETTGLLLTETPDIVVFRSHANLTTDVCRRFAFDRI